MRRRNAIAAALAALFSMAFALTAGLASANDPAAVVKGGGSGVLTDPDGNHFPVTCRDEDNFILQWCFLPEFQFYGSLSVELEDADDGDEDRRELGATVARRKRHEPSVAGDRARRDRAA
jgi:hypothetical protein